MANNTLRLGLVGLGKIARDEHLPAIAATEGAQLVAVASRNARAPGVANHPDLAAMLAAHPELDAIVLCQPPQARFESARMALAAGKHVFLEKPPGATLSEVHALVELARAQRVTLYASWHSRFAASVAPLKAWCANRTLSSVAITWKEDVRRWHPGQEWIWEPGGFGVFDPGINALSVVTEVLAERIRLIDATLTYPADRATPIAASLALQTAGGMPISAEFDWRQTGPQTWQIVCDAGDERYTFKQGGDDATHVPAGADTAINHEYRTMYQRFVALVRAGRSDVDLAPLELVADAFLRGRAVRTEAFEF